MRTAGLLLLLGSLLAAQPCYAFYDGSSVTVFTPSNMKEKLKARPALVEFYAPWQVARGLEGLLAGLWARRALVLDPDPLLVTISVGGARTNSPALAGQWRCCGTRGSVAAVHRWTPG